MESDLAGSSVVGSQSDGIELPKGGGAVRGISEKFSANPVTGTSSLSVPIPVSPARGFQPDISINYDSGAGNSVFGLGWQLATPSISRKTNNRLPEYVDESDSDTYSLTGVEDLVPFLQEDNANGFVARVFEANLAGEDWEVKLYRPRIEGSYSKIERWRQTDTNKIWWRTVSSSNVTTVFGFTDQACIFETGKREKTFEWLVEFTYDDKGHFTWYRYTQENLAGLENNKISESHRNSSELTNKYLKKVLYGIRESWIKRGLTAADLYTNPFVESDFHFQTVFDYGDHPGEFPTDQPDDSLWALRPDCYSIYRPGFEVRTYRRCERVLLFHYFPEELENEPELIRSLNLSYETGSSEVSLLASVTLKGFQRDESGQWVDPPLAYPPMSFTYAGQQISNEVQSIDTNQLADVPAGVDGRQYQWLDLYGEGLNGVLIEQSNSLYYKQNMGGGVFSPARALLKLPSSEGLARTWQFQNLEADGAKMLVATNGISKGYYGFSGEPDGDLKWEAFQPFARFPNIRLDDPNLRIIDLNGDGQGDICITEETAFCWYPSAGKQGFKEAQFSIHPDDGGNAPEVIFSNESESIFTADMSGDGLTDIVRIRNGEICYWPNLGYGRFGRKVVMDDSPRFNDSDAFDARHVRLSDINGSGTSDIVYIGTGNIQYWFNQNGNSWGESNNLINPFLPVDNRSTVSVIDLFGNGTGCLVCSSPLPDSRTSSVRYVDLLRGEKPLLLKSIDNGAGKTINLEYTTSTKFYLEDRAKGEPWVTRLHFPVHCLSQSETIDRVTGARFTTSYSYHHGYYDRAEREFRGFGRVDQIVSEEYEHFVGQNSSNALDAVFHQSPVLTKTWYHNGAYLDQERIVNQYETEYCSYQNPDYEHLTGFDLDPPELPENMDAAEWREALRACKGMALRTETYGLDGTELAAIPFSIAYSTCSIRRIQPKAENPNAIFEVQNSESITINLDRRLDDPGISQNLLLETNEYGMPLLSAVINYGRRLDGPEEIRQQQKVTQCVVTETAYTDDDFGLLGGHNPPDIFSPCYSPAGYKNTTYELGLEWQWGLSSNPNNLRLNPLQVAQKFADSEAHSVEYLRPAINEDGLDTVNAQEGERRLLSCTETRYANATLNGELPRGKQSSLGINWSSYQLAFTEPLIETIYGDKVNANMLDEAGYVHLDNDSDWWVPSGHAVYHLPELPGNEFENRFFIPFGVRDALGAAAWTHLDNYHLMPVISSVSRIGYDDVSTGTSYLELNESISINDYRFLSPKFIRDANHNWSGVENDGLGMVTRVALMGKVEGADAQNPPARNAETEGDNLENPTSIHEYGFFTENQEGFQPAWARSIQFTKHYSENQVPREEVTSRLEMIEHFEYSDGSGNIVMTKSQVEPGVAKMLEDGMVVEVDTRQLENKDRWLGNGRTIINNAGNPVKQYEPYFCTTHEFEDNAALVETGISALLFYDAAGRNICKLNPNRTYEKVIFDSWHRQNWDVNDTAFLRRDDGSIETNITQDPDVGHIFSMLEESEVSPSWYEERIDREKGETDEEKERNFNAAKSVEPHVATPGEIHTDALGRTIFSVAHNRVPNPDPDAVEPLVDERYKTVTHLDIEGNMMSVVDHRQNTVVQYRYGLLNPSAEGETKVSLYQCSMDAGKNWKFNDIQGKLVHSWDNRGHTLNSVYDGLHRSVESQVTEDNVTKTVGRNFYLDSDAEDLPAVRVNNQVGELVVAFDQAGRSESNVFDFKGNLLVGSLRLAQDYRSTLDWSGDSDDLLENELFFSETQYDAVNRIIRAESPHTESMTARVSSPAFSESGGLYSVSVSLDNESEDNLVKSIDYDAKGQRQRILYGNGVETEYEYESDTFRLKRLITKKGSQLWQDLNYTYDPVGNITEIVDAAQELQLHNNVATDSRRTYSYSATYQLIKATGREFKTQALIPSFENGWSSHAANNPHELQNYFQEYVYDSVGNIKLMMHRRPDDNMSGWTRNYYYHDYSNQLKSTSLGDIDEAILNNMVPRPQMDEDYTYNDHGSITSTNKISALEWNYAEQLTHIDLQGGGHCYYVYTGSGARTRKVWEKSDSLIEDRIYIGGWEILRRRVNGDLRLERETVHIMDDQRRIALVEIKTIDANSNAGFQPVIRYQMADHLSSASLELNEYGELISYEEYHPFGTTAYHLGVNSTDISAKRYRYTGKERDEESGFSYHQTRYYFGQLGRWISADKAGLKGGVNFYSYVKNNPIVYVDPGGTSEQGILSRIWNTIFFTPDFTPNNKRLVNVRYEREYQKTSSGEYVRGTYTHTSSDDTEGVDGSFYGDLEAVIESGGDVKSLTGRYSLEGRDAFVSVVEGRRGKVRLEVVWGLPRDRSAYSSDEAFEAGQAFMDDWERFLSIGESEVSAYEAYKQTYENNVHLTAMLIGGFADALSGGGGGSAGVSGMRNVRRVPAFKTRRRTQTDIPQNKEPIETGRVMQQNEVPIIVGAGADASAANQIRQFAPGQGFSFSMNKATGEWAVFPSRSVGSRDPGFEDLPFRSDLAEAPGLGAAPRNGTHRAGYNTLGGGDMDNYFGGSFVREEGNTLFLGFNSGMLNGGMASAADQQRMMDLFESMGFDIARVPP